MCWFTIVKCFRHNDIVARNTWLCDDGLRGSICMNRSTVFSANCSRSIYTSSSTLVVQTPTKFALSSECALPTRHYTIDCAVVDPKKFRDTDVTGIMNAYENKTSKNSSRITTQISVMTIDDESSFSDSTVNADDSISSVGTSTRSRRRSSTRSTASTSPRYPNRLGDVSEVDNDDVETYVSTRVSRNTITPRNPETALIKRTKSKPSSQTTSNVSTTTGRMIRVTRGSKAGSYIRVS